MHAIDDLLLAAVRAAPRRHALPPLPVDAAAAQGEGCETALAWAIEQARLARHHHAGPAVQVRAVFLGAMACFIREALDAQGGDAAFQALVLRAREPAVQEYVRLTAHEAADRRAVRARVDAVAHPGKLRGVSGWSEQLAQLHALASAGEWSALRAATIELLAHPAMDVQRETLQGLLASDALRDLERTSRLRHDEPVRAYVALCARQRPVAGSDAASASGRASARAGEAAEARTLAGFERIAQRLAQLAPDSGYRAVRSLRTPRGFPGEKHKAKDEWDAAIVRRGEMAMRIVLLAEVKVSPAAAIPDLARLLRGLQRLAHADEAAVYPFTCADGTLQVEGASLRSLHPVRHAPPPCVVYCCPSPPQVRPQFLAASSKAVLAAEPASIAYALRLARGDTPADEELSPVWDALLSQPRLRATLHQHETACTVRAAMVDAEDVARLL
jgi:hypothetical protein